MNLQQRINAFSLLGEKLNNDKLPSSVFQKAEANNRWFVKESIDFSLNEISNMLKKENLEQWLSVYPKIKNYLIQKTIGVIMAGNIPLVGFHDFLSVLITGHKIVIKLSSKDSILLKEISKILIDIEPEFENRISFTEATLKNFDAVIATGSNNTSKYFEYYFGKYPNIIRKNRTSVAILNGNETVEDFKNLGKDIFAYYGLGCRNVSKLFVPDNYNFVPLLDALSDFEYVYTNNKYANNRDYNSSVFLLNKIKHYDNNFLILTENIGYSAPISVVYFETYSNIETVYKRLDIDNEKIQCVVSNISDKFINFGKAQSPKLNDYADNIDTLEFLLKL